MKIKLNLITVSCLLIILALAVTSIQAFEPEIFDFEGETIVISNQHVTDRPEPGDDLYDRLIQAEEDFNVKVEFMDRVDREEIMAGVLAGDLPFDVFQDDNLVLANNEAVYHLDEVLGHDFFEELPEEVQGREGFESFVSLHDHIYGFPYMFPTYIQVTAGVFNPDMMEEYGLPNLYDLVDEGEWTWEKLREIAAELTEDTTGDGNVDQWGVGGDFSLTRARSTLSFFGTNNAFLTKEEDGEIKFNLDEGGRASYIMDMMNKISTVDGSLCPEGKGFVQQGDLFKEERIGIMFKPLYALPRSVNDNFDQGIIPLPKGPEREDYFYGVQESSFWSIPITAENPEALVNLVLSIFPPEERVQEDMESRLEAAQDKRGYENLKEMMYNFEIETLFVFAVDGPDWWRIERAMSGEMTPAEAISEIKPSIQARLDDFQR